MPLHYYTSLLHYAYSIVFIVFYEITVIMKTFFSIDPLSPPPRPPHKQTHAQNISFEARKKKMKLLFERRAAIEVETEAGTRGGGGGGGGRGGMRSIKKIIIIIKNDRTHRVRFSLF